MPISLSLRASINFTISKKIKLFFLFFLTFLILTNIINCSSSQDYSHSFIILVRGKEAGKELVTERSDIKGNKVCLSEQEMIIPGSKGKKKAITRTKLVFQKGKLFPVSYSHNSNTGTSYDIKVEDKKIIKTLKTENASTSSTTTSFSEDMLMLDLNAFHTINYLIRQYDIQKGGKQFLKAYLLPSAATRQISITLVKNITSKDKSPLKQFKNYDIEIRDRLNIRLWADNNNNLYRMFIKGPDIDVVRSDLYEKIKKELGNKEF